MVTKNKMVKQFFLTVACLMCLLVLVSAAQASQPGKAVKPDAEAAKVTVNINKATAEQLTVLPGVGTALAERIIKHRTEKGQFTSSSDLMAVKGIGKKKFDKMRHMVVVK